MSWYLKVTSKHTGTIINAEYRDITFAHVDEKSARAHVALMNLTSNANYFELMQDEVRHQTTFKFIPETKQSLKTSAREAKRNPILFMPTATFTAKLKKTKQI